MNLNDQNTVTKFEDLFSHELWFSTYKSPEDNNIDDTLRRIAKAAAKAENTPELQQYWEEQFFNALSNFNCTAGGRIYANAGTNWNGTSLFNCFVSPRNVDDIDSIDGILDDLKNQCKTLKSEGGWGQNFCLEINELLNVVRNGEKIFIPIGEVVSGDFVYSDDNQLHLVEDTIETIKEEMVTLTFDNGNTITCTIDHPFYVRRQRRKQWIQAQFISEKDIIITLSTSLKAIKKEFFNTSTRVIDLQIADRHNFAVGEDKIIVHNSHIRPRGSFIHKIGVESPGAVKFMEVYDKTSDVITSGSGRISNKGKKKIRKGALMGVMDCLAGNTLINLPNRSPIKIKDLVDTNPFVYTMDVEDTHFRIRKAAKIWYKGIKPTVKVEFDNGDYIECTPEHEFLLANLDYKDAQYLQPGEELCTLNSTIRVKSVSESIEQEVFDISVPIDHNFAANGVFVHNCWHPDIEEFIRAKQHGDRLQKFNLSVNCTDDFMTNLISLLEIKDMIPEEEFKNLDKWDLIFPDTTYPQYAKEWDGDINKWKSKGYPVEVHKTVSLTGLWNSIMENTYKRNDPGVLWIDRANYYNPLNYSEKIFATNPCVRGDTEVTLSDGSSKRIDELVSELDQEDLIEIYSYNIELGRYENDFVIAGQLTKENAELLELKFDDNNIIHVTPDHQIFTKNRGWVSASELESYDEIITL
jgi:ribonucleotide reductase alpha subunit